LELWESEIVSLRESGLSWRTLAGEIRARYPEIAAGNDDLQLRSKARNAWKKAERHRRGLKTALPGPREPLPAPRAASTPTDSALMDALIKGADLQGLADALGTSARVAEAMVQDVRDRGFMVDERDGIYRLARIIPPAENRVTAPWAGEKVVRFGLMGDTQLGCMDTQITLLHKLYDFYQAEGITSVFHTGDMTDGEKMRPGHEYELYVHGADAQAAHVAKVYPRRDGITTRFITGNHDYSFVKSIGMDIGRQVAAQREDMDYLGYMTAYVDLTPRCVMELHHPQDGTCFDDQTEILTKRGWIRFSQLTKQDEVATMTKGEHVFEWQRPTEITADPYRGTMYHFRARTLDMMVTPNHGMWTKVSDHRKSKRTELTYPQKAHPTVDYSFRRVTAEQMDQGYCRQKWEMTNHCDAWVGEVPFQTVEVPFVESKNTGMRDKMQHAGSVNYLDMAKLIAWYVTEGYADQKRVSICQSKRVNPDNHLEITSLIERIGMRYCVSGRDQKDINIGSVELSQYLRKECGSGSASKYIPDWVKGLPTEDLAQVLDVLIKGDGWNRKPSGFGYRSISKRLLDDVSEIAVKLGYAVSFTGECLNITDTQKRPTVNNRPKQVYYEGTVYCCRVPNQLILVRRNGKATWSHNSYALSYKIQKYIEAMSGGEKPKLLAVGHYHKQESFFYRNVHAFQTACLCGQTSWMRGKGISAALGGWLIELHVDDEGTITRIKPEFMPFYKAIREDYRNWA